MRNFMKAETPRLRLTDNISRDPNDFGFLDLPAELRNRIYEHALHRYLSIGSPQTKFVRASPNLLNICRYIRAEAYPTWKLHVQWQFSGFNIRYLPFNPNPLSMTVQYISQKATSMPNITVTLINIPRPTLSGHVAITELATKYGYGLDEKAVKFEFVTDNSEAQNAVLEAEAGIFYT